MTKGLTEGQGSENNRVKIGGVTTLLGDPQVRIEKPYTIIKFPGGDVEIARCDDGTYWVHVAVRGDGMAGGKPAAKIVGARIDFVQRYGDEANAVLRQEIEKGDVNHIAFRIQPP